MNKNLFERLLYEEESTTLDFKQEQYRFSKASDEDKSELLKDILGFANAWRRTEAYILVGVEDIRGQRANVVGLSNDHLDDHSLQQFVNSLTNRTVRFHYGAFNFEGKQVGIICIDEHQDRPLYIKTNYGKLKKNEVYIRRGSSTDPTKPAGPDELATMGQGASPKPAELTLEFSSVEHDTPLGLHISCDTEFCEMPPTKSIPLYMGFKWKRLLLSFLAGQRDPTDIPNGRYFKEFAKVEALRRQLSPISLVIKNIGSVNASGVRVELTINKSSGLKILEHVAYPKQPDHMLASEDSIAENPEISNQKEDVVIIESHEKFKIEIDCGVFQPGRDKWCKPFYLGKENGGMLELKGRIFAENLPRPQEISLTISIKERRIPISVTELTSLALSATRPQTT